MSALTRHRYFIRPKYNGEKMENSLTQIYLHSSAVNGFKHSIHKFQRNFPWDPLEVMKQHSGIRKSYKILEGGKWTIIESTNKPFDLSFNISFATHNHPRQQQNFLSISVQLFIYSCFEQGVRGGSLGVCLSLIMSKNQQMFSVLQTQHKM